MSLANPDRSRLCHCGNAVYIHPDGFTRDLCRECDSLRCDVPDPEYPCPVTKALVKSPTVWMTGNGQYMLTDLSEGHLERLKDALDSVSLEDSEGIELQHALYDI